MQQNKLKKIKGTTLTLKMITKSLYWLSQVIWFFITLPIAMMIYIFAMTTFLLMFIFNSIIKINHKPKANAKAKPISEFTEGLR